MLITSILFLQLSLSQQKGKVDYAATTSPGELKTLLEAQSKKITFKNDEEIREVLMTEIIGAYVLGNSELQKHPRWTSPGEVANRAKTSSLNIKALQAWWQLRVGSLSFPDPDAPNSGAQKITYTGPDGKQHVAYRMTKGHPLTNAGEKTVKDLQEKGVNSAFLQAVRYWGKPKFGEPTKLELEKAMESCPQNLRYLLIGPLATLEAKAGQKIRWWIEWKAIASAEKKPLLVQHMLEHSTLLKVK